MSGHLRTEIVGTAIIWGVPSLLPVHDADERPGHELFLRGAFDAVLSRPLQAVATINHDWKQIIGNTTAGNLFVWADESGLQYRIRPPDTPIGRGIVNTIRERKHRGTSCGFKRGQHDRISRGFGNADVVRVREVERLHEIALLTEDHIPVYMGTEIWLQERDYDTATLRWELKFMERQNA